MVRRLFLVLVVTAGLAACSDDDDGERLSASQDSTTSTTEATTTTLPVTTTSVPVVVTTVTTAKPATTTTAKPTTTTAIPADKASVTIVNNYPATMVVSVNGVSQTVGAGQRKGPFAVTPKATDGNDVVTLRRSDDPSCGTGSAGGWFDAGGKYELQLFVSAPSGCNGDKPSPGGRVEPGGGTI